VISDIATQDPFAITNFSSNITTGITPHTQGTFDVLFRPTDTKQAILNEPQLNDSQKLNVVADIDNKSRGLTKASFGRSGLA
jgi:hypothetical protein